MNSEQRHPIKVVSLKTGLSPHVIRIWERRYNAVSPQRTKSNRRLYSEEDIIRFQLLQKGIKSGRSIGQIAYLSNDELVELLKKDTSTRSIDITTSVIYLKEEELPNEFLSRCIVAIRNFDSLTLEKILARASVVLSSPNFMGQLIVPLMHRIGELWHEGDLRIAHEHMTSAIIRTVLGNIYSRNVQSTNAPILVSTTPIGQQHELGALLIAAMAVQDGWKVLYLGSNLPATEIANAVLQNQAHVLALSIGYPSDDPALEKDLQNLRQYLKKDIKFLVGGNSVVAYRNVLREIDATIITDLDEFRNTLTTIRTH